LIALSPRANCGSTLWDFARGASTPPINKAAKPFVQRIFVLPRSA
jgi:hypothetical protein